MLHGLGATLARRIGPARLRVLPAVSCVALACARLGWAEHEVDVISVVARPAEVILPAVQPRARVLVLGRDGATPVTIGALLADRGWGATPLTVLEHLGGSAERIRGPYRGPHREFSMPGRSPTCRWWRWPASRTPGTVIRPRVPGLPDDAYETDGQLTRREARALALAALAPGPGQLLWDIGAGSGSIGIEWMRTDPRARAIAVEVSARPGRPGPA